MSSALFVAIGAGVAVLTGIGAGIGIGKIGGSAMEQLPVSRRRQEISV